MEYPVKTPTEITRRQLLAFLSTTTTYQLFPISPARARDVDLIAPQPYFAAVNRALEALARIGSPLEPETVRQFSMLAQQNNNAAVNASEALLNSFTLAILRVHPDGVARGTAGGVQRHLMESGWRAFLLRVENPAGYTGGFNVTLGAQWGRPSRVTYGTGASRPALHDTLDQGPHFAQDWLTARLCIVEPMEPTLLGTPIEYKVIQLYSRDRGKRTSLFSFHTRPLGVKFRASVKLDFECLPSRDVFLHIRDSDGSGCMASLTIRDIHNQVYPYQGVRIAPDMYFHPHIYRADGETVRLPDGNYIIESKRGPEYLCNKQEVTINSSQDQIHIQLNRWIDPAEWGWYSGDTHIHAAGCSHYERPTEGVSPETMIRHVRGEGLSIGDVLTWGPSWYYQKQFFTGRAESPPAKLEHVDLQMANNVSLRPRATPKDSESLLRYDVEVSGFPSSHCGHLVLLNLKEQDYPGTKIRQDWPSWNLPILQWAKAQGAVVGYAHCGLGMVVDTTELPNYEIPPMNATGTQEAIVDVTHGMVDFISGCDTQPSAELNAWYHILNCGYRLALIGESDYPCITDERPGMGRSYVRLEKRPIGDEGYIAWIQNLQKGKLYCGDGRSHFLDFKVNDHRSGENDVLLSESSSSIRIEALVAARLEPHVSDEVKASLEAIDYYRTENGWHIESARIGTSREVAVDLIIMVSPRNREDYSLTATLGLSALKYRLIRAAGLHYEYCHLLILIQCSCTLERSRFGLQDAVRIGAAAVLISFGK